MKWFRIDKSGTLQPAEGSYSDWKEDLRREGRKQCAYCAIHEANFGGMRNFHVEHYRPQKHFPQLANTIANLFYACAICNSFKGHHWPGDPDEKLESCCFPDPSTCDFSEFMALDENQQVICSKNAGKYLVERLNLNRQQLVLVRRFVAIRARLAMLIEKNVDNQNPKVTAIMARVALHALKVDRIVPYEGVDTKRA